MYCFCFFFPISNWMPLNMFLRSIYRGNPLNSNMQPMDEYPTDESYGMFFQGRKQYCDHWK
jgi:hypothetical protein